MGQIERLCERLGYERVREKRSEGVQTHLHLAEEYLTQMGLEDELPESPVMRSLSGTDNSTLLDLVSRQRIAPEGQPDPFLEKAEMLVDMARWHAIIKYEPLGKEFPFLKSVYPYTWAFNMTVAGVFIAMVDLYSLDLDVTCEEALTRVVFRRLEELRPIDWSSVDAFGSLLDHVAATGESLSKQVAGWFTLYTPILEWLNTPGEVISAAEAAISQSLNNHFTGCWGDPKQSKGAQQEIHGSH